jgi:hypothetical protein
VSCDQAGILKIADPDRTIESLRDEINEAIAVRGMDVELRMALRHVGEHRSQVSWAESERRSHSQATAKLTVGQEQFSGRVDFGAGPFSMISKRDPGFRESGAASGPCKKLHAKFRFKPGELSTDE